MNGSFWQDPSKVCRLDGQMEKDMLRYRRQTKKPLITNCFRIIPKRWLKDDDANLVRDIMVRTLKLIEVAEPAFKIVKDDKKKPHQKLAELSQLLQKADGLGETWAKMMTVCIHNCYPHMRLRDAECEVG